MSLYRAETRRLVKRRFTKLFVLGAVLVLIAIAVGTLLTNQKVGPAETADAKARAQSYFQQAVAQSQVEKTSCEAAQGTPAAKNYPPSCSDVYQPTEADFNYEWYLPSTFNFRENFPGLVVALAALLAVAGFVIGASFVGAEWSSGGMMNLLLWRPQRVRVLATKMSAFLVVLTGLAVVLSAIWAGVFLLIADARGTTETMTSGAWQSLGLTELRGLAVVVVAGVLGFGLASIGRHTAMALGVVVAVVVVFQFGLGVVLSLAHVKWADAYLVPIWAYAWMYKTAELTNDASCDYSAVNGCVPEKLTLTWQMAGSGMAVLFVLVVVASLWTIRKRDIT